MILYRGARALYLERAKDRGFTVMYARDWHRCETCKRIDGEDDPTTGLPAWASKRGCGCILCVACAQAHPLHEWEGSTLRVGWR